MERRWVKFAVAAGAFVTAWTGVGLLQAGLFNVVQGRFWGSVSEGLLESDPMMSAVPEREGAWQVVSGLVLLLAVFATLRWTRSGLAAAGAALTVVSLTGFFAMAAEALPVVLVLDFLIPGHGSVEWSPTVSDTEFLASGIGIAVGATFLTAGMLSRGPRRAGLPTPVRAAGAALGILLAVAGTAALAAGAAMNYSALVRLEEVWPTSGLYSFMAEDQPVDPLGVFLVLVGAAMMAASVATVRRSSIGVGIAASIWTVLAAIAFFAPAVLGGAGVMVTDGLTLIGAWLVVPALTAAAVLTRVAGSRTQTRDGSPLPC